MHDVPLPSGGARWPEWHGEVNVRTVIRTTWFQVGAALGVAFLLSCATAPSAGDAASGDLDGSVAAVIERPGLPADLASTIAARSDASAPALDARTARTAIEKANSEWLAAFRRGDSAAMAGFYAADASLFPPTNANLEGPDRIVEYFAAQRSAGMDDPSLKTLEVVAVGDIAYEVGVYGFRFETPGRGFGGDAGRYFAIWKAQPDGSLRYQVGIWSSDRDVREKP